MSTITKIKTVPLSRFSNAEYLTYLNSVMELLPPPSGKEDDRPVIESSDPEVEANGSPDIGLTAEFVRKMSNDLMRLADAVNESRIAQETEQADVHEKNRDQLVIYITTRISRAGTLPLEAERDAGKFLYKVIKPYIGAARLPVAQETAAIQGMLIDLRKEENAPYVTTLGLDAYLAELETENNAYSAITLQRTENRAANKVESGASVRLRLDGQYDDLVTLAQAYSIAAPSETASTFVSNLNQLITETVTAYHQRGKASRSASDKDDDRPLIP